MKKFNLSLVAVLAMSTLAMAGGDVTPLEPVITEPIITSPEVVTSNAGVGFYTGIAYGWQKVELNDRISGTTDLDDNFGSIMINAGYKLNPYVALEGRYWFGLGSTNDLGWTTGWDDADITINSWGVYVKPMYPVSSRLDLYALLGYASTDVEVDAPVVNGNLSINSADGFSWGIGAEYAASDNVGIFVDYTSMVDGEQLDLTSDGSKSSIDESVHTVNFGINYHF